MEFARQIYRDTASFPKHELYGLTAQLRRAAVSIASNIAEGQARFSKPEFRHFLRQSRGSLAEIETQLELARELGFLSKNASNELLRNASELGRMLNGLIKSLESDRN